MDIALRTDASPAIGLGHFKRCLSLAEALREHGARCCFVSRDLGVDVSALARAAGFATLLLPVPANSPASSPASATARAAHAGATDLRAADAVDYGAWLGVSPATDAADTVAALRGHPPAWVVVDHYALAAPWHRAVAQALACRVAAIDDLADRDLAVDLLIDHNHALDHRSKYGGHLPTQAELLGGPNYALLGAGYAGAQPHAVAEAVNSIGIFMGGVDAAGLSALALQACGLAGFEGPIEVATTSANPHGRALAEAVARVPQARLLLDQPDLQAFFARHGLQIGAGGGATWERCCMGAPTLALVAAANQRPVLEPLSGMGVLALADTPPACEPWTAAGLAPAIRKLLSAAPLRRGLSAAARALVDGQGAGRVAQRLLSPS